MNSFLVATFLAIAIGLHFSDAQGLSCSCSVSGGPTSYWAGVDCTVSPSGKATWVGVYPATNFNERTRSLCPASPSAEAIATNQPGSYSSVRTSVSFWFTSSSTSQYVAVLWQGTKGDCSAIPITSFIGCQKPGTSSTSGNPRWTSSTSGYPRWIDPSTPPPRQTNNSGLWIAIFVPIGIVVVVIVVVVIVIVRRRQRVQAAQMSAYSSVPLGPLPTSTNPLQYGQPPAVGMQPTMTFIPAPLPGTATGVAPPTYMMSSPGGYSTSPAMVYMPQGDPTMSSAQPVFIATATNPNPGPRQ